MPKTWLWRVWLAGCLGMVTAAAFGSAYPEADRYFAVRHASHAIRENVSFTQVQANAALWQNDLIEVRGVILGCARRDDGGTLIIGRDAGDSFVVDSQQKLPDQTCDISHTVRVLARIPRDQTSFNSLQLVAVTSEYDAANLEYERAKQQAQQLVASQPAPRVTVRSHRRSVRQALRRREALRRGRARETQLASRGLDLLSQYAAAVRWFNPRLTEADAWRLAQSITSYSVRYGLDARLIMAVIAVESNFNANAVSPKGAMGLGQLMPGTASGLGVADPWSPEQNIEGATRLLRGHLSQVGAVQAPTWDQIKLALACYNAGAGAVRKYKGVPPYRETQNYIKKVGRLYYEMCGLTPPE